VKHPRLTSVLLPYTTLFRSYVSACNRPSSYADAVLAIENFLTSVHGDRGPGSEVDAIAVVQGYLVADADLRTVDQRAVDRTRIEHGPVAVRRRDQHRVQPADARISRRSGQVDLRGQAARYAAPPDPHLVPDELETAFGVVGREGDGRAFRP